MTTVKKSIDVDVPVRVCYDQWTQFEDFPQFMEGVEQVTQLDERHNHWKTTIAGASREFDTEIVDQLPDEKIAWRTVGGEIHQRGVVTFRRLDDAHTRVHLALEFEPEGMAEHVGSALGMVDRRVAGDLDRFKDYIEHRGTASGAWRGRISPN